MKFEMNFEMKYTSKSGDFHKYLALRAKWFKMANFQKLIYTLLCILDGVEWVYGAEICQKNFIFSEFPFQNSVCIQKETIFINISPYGRNLTVTVNFLYLQTCLFINSNTSRNS